MRHWTEEPLFAGVGAICVVAMQQTKAGRVALAVLLGRGGPGSSSTQPAAWPSNSTNCNTRSAKGRASMPTSTMRPSAIPS